MSTKTLSTNVSNSEKNILSEIRLRPTLALSCYNAQSSSLKKEIIYGRWAKQLIVHSLGLIVEKCLDLESLGRLRTAFKTTLVEWKDQIMTSLFDLVDDTISTKSNTLHDLENVSLSSYKTTTSTAPTSSTISAAPNGGGGVVVVPTALTSDGPWRKHSDEIAERAIRVAWEYISDNKMNRGDYVDEDNKNSKNDDVVDRFARWLHTNVIVNFYPSANKVSNEDDRGHSSYPSKETDKPGTPDSDDDKTLNGFNVQRDFQYERVLQEGFEQWLKSKPGMIDGRDLDDIAVRNADYLIHSMVNSGTLDASRHVVFSCSKKENFEYALEHKLPQSLRFHLEVDDTAELQGNVTVSTKPAHRDAIQSILIPSIIWEEIHEIYLYYYVRRILAARNSTQWLINNLKGELSPADEDAMAEREPTFDRRDIESGEGVTSQLKGKSASKRDDGNNSSGRTIEQLERTLSEWDDLLKTLAQTNQYVSFILQKLALQDQQDGGDEIFDENHGLNTMDNMEDSLSESGQNGGGGSYYSTGKPRYNKEDPLDGDEKLSADNNNEDSDLRDVKIDEDGAHSRYNIPNKGIGDFGESVEDSSGSTHHRYPSNHQQVQIDSNNHNFAMVDSANNFTVASTAKSSHVTGNNNNNDNIDHTNPIAYLRQSLDSGRYRTSPVGTYIAQKAIDFYKKFFSPTNVGNRTASQRVYNKDYIMVTMQHTDAYRKLDLLERCVGANNSNKHVNGKGQSQRSSNNNNHSDNEVGYATNESKTHQFVSSHPLVGTRLSFIIEDRPHVLSMINTILYYALPIYSLDKIVCNPICSTRETDVFTVVSGINEKHTLSYIDNINHNVELVSANGIIGNNGSNTVTDSEYRDPSLMENLAFLPMILGDVPESFLLYSDRMQKSITMESVPVSGPLTNLPSKLIDIDVNYWNNIKISSKNKETCLILQRTQDTTLNNSTFWVPLAGEWDQIYKLLPNSL